MCTRGKMLFSLLFNASHYHHSPAWEELHSFLNVANRQSASYNFHRVEEGGIPLMGWGVCGMGVSCRSGGTAVIIGSWTYIETEFYFGTESAETLCLCLKPHLICSIYILQSHHCNQVGASINMLMFILCSVVIFQKTMSRFLQSRLQFYSQFVPRSQFHLKLCRVFPNQLDGAWISHVVRVRAGVNLCALALFTVQRVGTEGKRCRRLSISCSMAGRGFPDFWGMLALACA